MKAEDTQRPLLRELERSGMLPFPVQPRRIARDASREDEPLERHLVLHESVPRADLIRAVIDLKGTHAIRVDGDWVESGIGDTITRKEAHTLGMCRSRNGATASMSFARAERMPSA